MSVGIGFIAARTTSGSPLVMPPSRPPAWFVGRLKPALGVVVDARRAPGCRARLRRAKPSPISKPLIAGIDITAAASRASSRPTRLGVRAESRHQPGGGHHEHAAERLAVGARVVDERLHRLGRLGVRAAQRARLDGCGDRRPRGQESVPSSPSRSTPRRTRPPRRARAGTPWRRRPQRHAPPSRARSRARGCRACRRSRSSARPRDRRDPVAARSLARPRGARPATAITSSQFSKSRFATPSAMGLPMVLPKRTPERIVTRSVSMR